MTKLEKDFENSGWAVNGRGKRVPMPAYRVLIDGVFAARIESCLGSGGRRCWMIKGNSLRREFYRRKEIVSFIERRYSTKLTP